MAAAMPTTMTRTTPSPARTTFRTRWRGRSSTARQAGVSRRCWANASPSGNAGARATVRLDSDVRPFRRRRLVRCEGERLLGDRGRRMPSGSGCAPAGRATGPAVDANRFRRLGNGPGRLRRTLVDRHRLRLRLTCTHWLRVAGRGLLRRGAVGSYRRNMRACRRLLRW